MLTITTHTKDKSRHNDKLFEESGHTTTFIIFKPRTKSVVVQEKTTELLLDAYNNGLINKFSISQSYWNNIPAYFSNYKCNPTTRIADSISYGFGKYILAANEWSFQRSIRFFNVISDFTALGTTKFSLLTHSTFADRYGHVHQIASGRTKTSFMVFKCKTMETYEIFEKLSQNQSLLPFDQPSHIMNLFHRILHTDSIVKSQSWVSLSKSQSISPQALRPTSSQWTPTVTGTTSLPTRSST